MTSDAEVDSCNMGTEEEKEQEQLQVIALWLWLQSFPQLEDACSVCIPGAGEAASEEEKTDALCAAIEEWLYDSNVSRCILGTAQEIFSTDESTNSNASQEIWKQIHRITSPPSGSLDPTLRSPKGSKDRISLLERLLCHAVSAESTQRQEYIARILNLKNVNVTDETVSDYLPDDLDVQSLLMHIIEYNMKQTEKTDKSEPCDSDSDNDNDEEVEDTTNTSIEGNDQHAQANVENEASENETQRVTRKSPTFCKSGYTPERKKSHLHNDFNDTKRSFKSSSSQNIPSSTSTNQVITQLQSQVETLQTENNTLRQDAQRCTNGECCASQQLLHVLTERYKAETTKREAERIDWEESLKTKYKVQALQQDKARLDAEDQLRSEYEQKLREMKEDLHQAREKSQHTDKMQKELETLRDEVDVLQHCQHKLRHTEEQLVRCRAKMQDQNTIKDQLVREEEAHAKAVEQLVKAEQELESLQPLKKQLEQYQVKASTAEVALAECQFELKRLKRQKDDLKNTNAELTSVTSLQKKEADQMQQMLELSNKEGQQGGQANGVGDGISELNPELMVEVKRLRTENTRLQSFAAKRTNDAVSQLETECQDKQRLANTFKKELLTKKMLLDASQLEVARLEQNLKATQQAVDSCQAKLKQMEGKCKEERQKRFEERKAAAEELQSVKKDLSEKARQDIAHLRKEHTEIILAEKEERRQALQKEREQARQLEERLQQEKEDLRKRHATSLEGVKREGKDSMAKLTNQYEDAKTKLETKVDELKDAIEKANEMLSSERDMAVQEMEEQREKHEAEYAELKQSCADMCRKYQDIEKELKVKIMKYKRGLQVANGKASALEEQNGDLEQEKMRLTQEKSKMMDENKRMRREVGSRLGAESNLESEHQELQRECTMILEENKELKRKLKNVRLPTNSSEHSFVEEGTSSGPIRSVSNSTMAQVRAEYDSRIQELVDEKRQLVLKSNAAFAEKQKAEQRARQREEELVKTKEKLTTAQLHVQRLENFFSASHSRCAKCTGQQFPTLQHNSTKYQAKDESKSTQLVTRSREAKRQRPEQLGTPCDKENQPALFNADQAVPRSSNNSGSCSKAGFKRIRDDVLASTPSKTEASPNTDSQPSIQPKPEGGSILTKKREKGTKKTLSLVEQTIGKTEDQPQECTQS